MRAIVQLVSTRTENNFDVIALCNDGTVLTRNWGQSAKRGASVGDPDRLYIPPSWKVIEHGDVPQPAPEPTCDRVEGEPTETESVLLLLNEAISLGRRDGMAGQHLGAMCDARAEIGRLRAELDAIAEGAWKLIDADALHGDEWLISGFVNDEPGELRWVAAAHYDAGCGVWRADGDGERFHPPTHYRAKPAPPACGQ